MINKIKNINPKVLLILSLTIFALEPFIGMDYLAYDFLNSINLPLISTIFHLIYIPLIVILVFINLETKKKLIGTIVISYLFVIGVYAILHSLNAIAIFDSLYLTNNFYFSIFKEFIYIYTLIIPYFMCYIFVRTKINSQIIKKIMIVISLIISISIILGDLFGFGFSTYLPSNTQASIFSWLSNDPEILHPRALTSKFFFLEGNTLGIYLFTLLPILYFYLATSLAKKDKVLLGLTIFLQSIAMMMLGTKVATYGSLLMPIMMLGIYLLFLILKKVQLAKLYLAFSAIMIVFLAVLLPISPAYINTQIDNANDTLVLDDDYLLQEGKAGAKGIGDLVPGTAEYNYFYIHYFEDYGIKSNLASSIPKDYYTLFYNYKFDGKFWWDVLDLYPLEARTSGRQIETIFTKYKWEPTSTYTKVMGLGYTTFMNGSIVIETDFVMQMYLLGYFGGTLLLFPYLIVLLYGVIKIAKNLKQNFTFETVVFALAYLIALGAAYTSGHTLDQYMTTTLIALIVSVLIRNVSVK